MEFPPRLTPAAIRSILHDFPARVKHVSYTLYNNNHYNNDPMDVIMRRDVTCFRCGETGHKKGECRTWKTKRCTNPNCHNSVQCAFAHSHEPLRTPWMPKCVTEHPAQLAC